MTWMIFIVSLAILALVCVINIEQTKADEIEIRDVEAFKQLLKGMAENIGNNADIKEADRKELLFPISFKIYVYIVL